MAGVISGVIGTLIFVKLRVQDSFQMWNRRAWWVEDVELDMGGVGPRQVLC